MHTPAMMMVGLAIDFLDFLSLILVSNSVPTSEVWTFYLLQNFNQKQI
jgi:hypothetical protein